MRHRLDQRGETLVEVVMALAILSMVLTGAYVIATHTFSLGRGAGQRSQAVDYLQQQAEALRSYRDASDWDSGFVAKVAGFTTTSGTSFCMLASPAATPPATWTPTEVSGGNCRKDGIDLTITAEPKGTLQDSLAVFEEYSFVITANWAGDNHTSVTTLLTNQEPN